jgi:hypothetical protein
LLHSFFFATIIFYDNHHHHHLRSLCVLGTTVSTMPPHHQHSSNGFTSNLLETLQASRLEVDAHVDRQKQYMDAQVVTYQNKLATEQATVQAQEKALETVRSERGVTTTTDTTSTEAGISKRRHDLTVQQTELQERIQSLEDEQEKQTHVVEGES